MGEIEKLKKDIIAAIYQNKDGKITGQGTQGILLEMVDVLSEQVSSLEERVKVLEGSK